MLIRFVRAFLCWFLALALLLVPLVVLLGILNRDFNEQFTLPEKALVAVAGFIAIILACKKELNLDSNATKQSLGLLVICLLVLMVTGMLKILLFDSWKGGAFSEGFSAQDFDVGVSTFWAAAYKPWSFLRYVLFGSFLISYLSFVAGAWLFVVQLLPDLHRYKRFFRFRRPYA